MTHTNINQQVDITQMGFKKNLEAYPRRMEFNGGSYEFVDSGLRCNVKSGSLVAQILTMTDGFAQYRLKTDNKGGNWTLLSITA